MNTKSLTKFKWFWAWQDEKEEAWLAEEAREGLHLQDVSPFGFYHFQEGQPGDYVYRLDFQSLKARDRESYLQLFEDAGWEHIGDMGGWVYFRHKVSSAELPEIYSDLESKVGKYQRVLGVLVILLPIMVILLPDAYKVDSLGGLASVVVAVLSAVLLLLFSYAVIMLIRRINQLKKTASPN
jgi:hypothetical protein